MLTQVESEYVKGLISSYQLKGYKYYVCHTVTEYNYDYDVCIYFSKEEIKAVDNNIFSITNGIKIYIDSSSRSYYQGSYRDTPRIIISDNNYTGTFNINLAEFIYTNANIQYSETSYIINPDITKSGVTSYQFDFITYLLCFLSILCLLDSFIRSILRIK